MGIVVLILLAFAVAAFIRTGRAQSRPDYRSGAEILAERFARGEIDAETFRSMKKDLENA